MLGGSARRREAGAMLQAWQRVLFSWSPSKGRGDGLCHGAEPPSPACCRPQTPALCLPSVPPGAKGSWWLLPLGMQTAALDPHFSGNQNSPVLPSLCAPLTRRLGCSSLHPPSSSSPFILLCHQLLQKQFHNKFARAFCCTRGWCLRNCNFYHQQK